MADIRINGTSSKNNYGFYTIVNVGNFNPTTQKIPLTINLYLQNSSSRFNSGGWVISIITDGVENKTTNVTINSTVVGYNESFLVKKITTNVEPTKTSVNVSATLSKSSYSTYDPGKCSLSGNVSLPTVGSTWGIGSLALTNIEDEFTLQINKYVENYTNKVTITDLQMSTTIKTINNAQNGDNVKFTLSELNNIYVMGDNKTTNNLRFYLNLYTYDENNVQIGSVQRLTADGYLLDAKPTATYTITEKDTRVSQLLGVSSNYVVYGASDLLFDVIPQPKKGATIDKITLDGLSVLKLEDSYQITLGDVEKSTFSLSIVDSRKNETIYNIEKILIPYTPLNINSFKFKRESQTSDAILLNTNIMCYNGNIGNTHNNVVVSFKFEGDDDYTTIPSDAYDIEDNVLNISNHVLSKRLPFNQSKTIYLYVSDLLTNDEENGDVLKGIATFEAGEHDFQVNGDLYIADINRENKIDVGQEISKNRNIITFTGTIQGSRTGTVEGHYNSSTGLVVINFNIQFASTNGNTANTHNNQFIIPTEIAPKTTIYNACYCFVQSNNAPITTSSQVRIQNDGYVAVYAGVAFKAVRGTIVYYTDRDIDIPNTLSFGDEDEYN